MEQGVLPYQGSSNPTFQEEEELSPVKEQIFIYMDGNKKMISLHELKFPDLDAFQVNTSAVKPRENLIFSKKKMAKS